ncbi:DIS3-like exonuclease 2 [Schistosoma japonicum]|nr:DIS3-like exonuclease 2 [Schistosoma japonicum]
MMWWSVRTPLRYHLIKPVAFSPRFCNNINQDVKIYSFNIDCWRFCGSSCGSSFFHTDFINKRGLRKTRRVNSKSDNIDALLERGNLIQAKLHRATRTFAYVLNPFDGQRIYIYYDNRKNALNEDVVLVELLPIGEWKSTEAGESCVLDSPLDTLIDADASESSLFQDQIPYTPIEFKKYCFYTVKQVIKSSQNVSDNRLLEILKNLDLSSTPSASCPLPCSNLIRTGVVKKVLKSNPANQKLLGRLAFYPNDILQDSKNKVSEVVSTDNNFSCVFLPYFSRHPLVIIDPSTVPSDTLKNNQIGLENNYVCQITNWNEKSKYPFGVIEENLGNLDELERATKSILIDYGIKDDQFTQEDLQGLPINPNDFKIPETEYKRRRDFRSQCVITIDPENAKDFDDALHITRLDNGLYEVGIHVADVSYFVHPNSPLDKRAADRTTSVYLVQRVIPMLPPILSQHLCSLVPNEDRLAFSILLTVKEHGEIVDEWFGRSVIRSRCRLTYDEAWCIIQMTQSNSQIENKSSLLDVLPKPEAPFTFHDLQSCLSSLHKIAKNLRSRRIENGAISLEKVELNFNFPKAPSSLTSEESEQAIEKCADKESGTTIWPQGFSVKIRNPAHYLIEEWMLIANQAVARFLFGSFIRYLKGMESLKTDTGNDHQMSWFGALLRNHPKPNEKRFDQLIEIAKTNNIDLDISNSASLSCSIKKLVETIVNKESYNESFLLNLTCSLSYMTYIRLSVALYFNLDSMYNILHQRCIEGNLLGNISYDSHHLRMLSFDPQSMTNQKDKTILNYTWHYGLNVPLYTHFTSPIRRYADLIVHRQMARILGCDDSLHPELEKLFGNNINSMLSDPEISEMDLVATWCNDRRLKARRAGEASQRLFLTACIRFLKNVSTWKRSKSIKITEPTNGLSNNSSLSDPSYSIMVTWNNPDDNTIQNVKQSQITILSILPCRVFCLPNTLTPRAELVTPDHIPNQNVH